jgi:hypothetical protein
MRPTVIPQTLNGQPFPTSERARWPRQLVRAVYQTLEDNGYSEPPPEFSELWLSLFG